MRLANYVKDIEMASSKASAPRHLFYSKRLQKKTKLSFISVCISQNLFDTIRLQGAM